MLIFAAFKFSGSSNFGKAIFRIFEVDLAVFFFVFFFIKLSFGAIRSNLLAKVEYSEAGNHQNEIELKPLYSYVYHQKDSILIEPGKAGNQNRVRNEQFENFDKSSLIF